MTTENGQSVAPLHPIVMRLLELQDRWRCKAKNDSRHFYESADAIEHCADELGELIEELKCTSNQTGQG